MNTNSLIIFKHLLNNKNDNLRQAIKTLCNKDKIKFNEVALDFISNNGLKCLLKENINKYCETNNINVSSLSEEIFVLALEIGGKIHINYPDFPGWGKILQHLFKEGYTDVSILIDIISIYLIEYKDDEVLEPLCTNDAIDAVSYYQKIDRDIIVQEYYKDDLSRIKKGEDFDKFLKTIKMIPTIKDVHKYIMVYDSIRRRFVHLDPPWKVFDIPCFSIGWRMGAGDDYMDEWHEFWDSLNEFEKKSYFRFHKPKGKWSQWVEHIKSCSENDEEDYKIKNENKDKFLKNIPSDEMEFLNEMMSIDNEIEKVKMKWKNRKRKYK